MTSTDNFALHFLCDVWVYVSSLFPPICTLHHMSLNLQTMGNRNVESWCEFARMLLRCSFIVNECIIELTYIGTVLYMKQCT